MNGVSAAGQGRVGCQWGTAYFAEEQRGLHAGHDIGRVDIEVLQYTYYYII